MSSPDTRALAEALRPLVSRMRLDITARKGKGGAFWEPGVPMTLALLEQHLSTGPARGLCPIRAGESTTRVAVLDFDSHRGEVSWARMVAVVSGVCDALALRGLRPVPFRSSGGSGVHLICLWERDQDAHSVRALLGEALARCGLQDRVGGVAKGCVEVFPKQDDVPIGGHGNMVILPLAGESVPLDPLFGFEPLTKADVLTVDWPMSAPVELRERPARVSAALEPPDDLERVRSALFAIPNDEQDYDWFYRLYCAVHEALGGSEDARELMNEWSAQAPWHDEAFNDSKVWRYLQSPENRLKAITRATLYHQAGQHGWSPAARQGDADGFDDVEPELVQQAQQQLVAERSVAVQEQREALFEAKERWRSAILAAPDERTLVTGVCPQIAADSALDSTTRGMLAEALKVTLGKLGSKAGIADCRKLIAPPKREKAKPRDDGHWQAGHWTERWVYVTDEDAFYKLDSEEVLSMQSFNAKFNRYLPPADDGEFRKSAAWVALEECSIPTVTRRVYLPWAGPLFELNGVACANSFRPSSMPEIAAEYTPEGLALIDRIKRHVGLLCGGRQDVAEVLLSWMAFQVQQPGKKVRWAPVIKGVQGDGKTLLGRVLSACLGMPNVKIVGPQVLGTSFQDWAHGACVAVLEEIRLSGHNRFEVLDTLKPYVTNNEISIHPKGAKPFDVLNTQNYMAFTNHSDALPIDETDRRWFVIFTPMTSIEDLKNVVGDLGAYFDSIYDPLEKHAGEVRKWMSEMVLHPQFQPNGRAMDTDEKASMISMSVSNEEEMLKEAISEGGVGVTEQVVVVSSLLAVVNSKNVDEPFNAKTLSLALKKLGWIKVGLVKWRSKPVRVWVKGVQASDTDAIRQALDQSRGNTSDEGDPFA